MKNDQYQIPRTPETNPSPLFSAELPQSPEWHQQVKGIEAEIEQMRRAADGSVLQADGVRGILNGLTLGRLTDEELMKKFIEAESLIGGRIAPAAEGIISQRFWYHDNSDWFYEAVDRLGVMYARYHTGNGKIEKLVGGRAVPLGETEQADFITLSRLLHRALKEELYERAKTSPVVRDPYVQQEMRQIDSEIQRLQEDAIVKAETKNLDDELEYLLSVKDIRSVLPDENLDLPR